MYFVIFSVYISVDLHEKSEGNPPDLKEIEDVCTLQRGQTSEAFFVLFSGILFNVKWKHEQGCIK